MNLGGKQDLDALLKSWPAPLREQGAAANEQDEERNWEERADAIVRAALASKQEGASGDALAILMAAPTLAPEPGEPGAEDAGRSSITAAAGEKKMSQEEKEPGDSAASTATPLPTERKRTSLKEIAARANQSGGGPRSSASGVATPAPPSVAPSGRSAGAASTPLPRPVEAGKDDSGVINLNVVRASVTAQQLAAAEKAKPASEGLFEDEHTVESAHNPAVKAPIAKATSVAVVKAKKSNTGPIAGVAIAVLGMAAAFGIVSTRKPAAPPPIAAVEKAAPVATVAPLAPSAAPTAAAVAVASAEATAAAGSEPDGKPADTARVAVAAPSYGGTVAPAKEAPSASADSRLAVKAPATPGKPGTLQEEMAHAVGSDGAAKPETGPVPEPASGPKNQNVPEQPAQGAVAAAVNGVTGAAKACVAGADDVSRANLTFSSSGAVSSVSVTGWAAAHGKSGCVQAALKGAKVGAFSRPSYTFSMTIRP